MIWRDAWDLLKATGKEWLEDKVPRLGAALAFYSVLSLAPLLVIVMAVAALVFGEEAARGQLVDQFDHLVGPEGAKAIEAMIVHAQKPKEGILAAVLGVIMLFFGALGVFGQLQDALNTIWEVQTRPGLGIWRFIKGRLLSFTMVLGVCFLLLVSLVLSAALSGLGDYLNSLANGLSPLIQAVNLVVSFAVITLLFALIFKVLPDVLIAWRDVWIGAVISALLFTFGKFLLGLYLGRSSVGSAYGAAGSLVVLVVWLYYSAQILFFGAEFTQVYAKKRGTAIMPSADAIPLTEEARAQEGLTRECATQR